MGNAVSRRISGPGLVPGRGLPADRRRSRRPDDVALPTAGLVRLVGADFDRLVVVVCGFAVDEPLVPGGRFTALGADGPELVDVLGEREELWHRFERFAAVGLVPDIREELNGHEMVAVP